MTLRDTILALHPVHYWLLDETTGSTFADIGSSPNPLNGTGDFVLGGIGPEVGSFAYRVYAGGQFQSSPLGTFAWTDFTFLVLFTFPANANPSSAAPFAGIGDINNPATRGYRIQQQSTTQNAATVFGSGTGVSLSGGTPVPVQFWHLAAITQTSATPTRSLYIDQSLASSSAGTFGTVPTSADAAWIKSAWPIVLSHMAIWNRALTLVEIQSISTQFLTWPYGEPINVPLGGSGSGGGGGGLTADQAAQLSDIQSDTNTMVPQVAMLPGMNEVLNVVNSTTDAVLAKANQIYTDTQNIVNSLFPQLETPLNFIEDTVTNILNGITTTITTAAGSVGQTLGDFFAQHSKDQFGKYNVTSGPTCARIDWTAGAAAYWGLTVNITSWPSEWTFTTPDDGWSIRDMAVLTIKIGEEQEVRHGIHTKSFTVSPLPGSFPLGVSGVGVPVLPPNYHIIVDWAGGVCGELLLHYLP